MIDSYWSKLKSGTDIRGIANNGIDGENINLTDNVIQRIAFAFILWISNKTKKEYKNIKVAIGHDSRISADRIKSILVKTFAQTGLYVYDCGLSSTPAMFMTTISLDCDASIEITASHHPFNRNGLKFFTKSGGLESNDIEDILQIAQNNQMPLIGEFGKVEKINFMDTYSRQLREIICSRVKNHVPQDKPLKGFKIIVDAGNGVGGFYALNVLKPLGADISGSKFLEPDGTFPHHIPNPEDKDAMKSASNAVKEAKADLGIIFDTDVDRASVVDSTGGEINRNKIVALASYIALLENNGGTIVTDSITSTGLTEFIEKELKGTHHRYKRGYKNVINEAKKLNEKGINCPLAIETSGHAAFRENYFLDDGAYLVTKIIIEMVNLKNQGIELQNLLKNLKEPIESLEVRLPILKSDFKSYGDKIIDELKDFASQQKGWELAKNNYEGVRVNTKSGKENGWFLLRLSVHDPIMPLNIESDSKGGVEKTLSKLKKFLKSYTELDTSNI